jgi:hypothetical protein
MKENHIFFSLLLIVVVITINSGSFRFGASEEAAVVCLHAD